MSQLESMEFGHVNDPTLKDQVSLSVYDVGHKHQLYVNVNVKVIWNSINKISLILTKCVYMYQLRHWRGNVYFPVQIDSFIWKPWRLLVLSLYLIILLAQKWPNKFNLFILDFDHDRDGQTNRVFLVKHLSSLQILMLNSKTFHSLFFRHVLVGPINSDDTFWLQGQLSKVWFWGDKNIFLSWRWLSQVCLQALPRGLSRWWKTEFVTNTDGVRRYREFETKMVL